MSDSRQSPKPTKILFPDDISCNLSDQIGEATLGAAKIGDTEPQEQGHHPETEQEAWKIKRVLPAQDAPAEAVNDDDHWVQAVAEAPALRHNRARIPDRRDVEPELDDE